MRFLYFITLLIFSVIIQAQSTDFNYGNCPLHFETNKSEVSLPVKEVIDSVWDNLNNRDKVEFSCLSNSEKQHLSEARQYKLSLERAQKVEQYLYEKEISSRYIQYKLDYFDHITNGRCGTKENLKAFKNLKGIVYPVLEKGTYYRKKYISSSRNLTNETCQEFFIDPNDEQTIVGEQHTQVRFSYQCFDLDYSKPINQLKVVLCEYYKTSDILLSGLTTQQNELMLETGGMIFLSVYDGEKSIHLKKGKQIQIIFPFHGKLKKDGMLAFDGIKQDGLVNWQLNESAIVEQSSASEPLEYLGEGEEEGMIYEEEGNQYNSIDGYLMKTDQLGWINCDRFWKVENPTELIVKIEHKEKNFGTRIIFKDINSVLPLYNYSPRNEVKSNKLPSGKVAYVMSYTLLKDKKTVLFDYKKIVTGEVAKVKLSPQPISVKELKAKLDLLVLK